MTGTVAEISIVRPRAHLVFGRDTPCADPAVQPICVEDVIRDLRRDIDAGAGAVLLTVDAIGGTWKAALALYGALRDVSASGRPVVAYVEQYAASIASWYVLAADYVVMAPVAEIIVHGSVHAHDLSTPLEMPDGVMAVYEARTNTPRPMLDHWVALHPNTNGAPEYQILDASMAVALGWADAIGTRADALALAERLAANERPGSARRESLAARPAPAALAAAEEQARIHYMLALAIAAGAAHQ